MSQSFSDIEALVISLVALNDNRMNEINKMNQVGMSLSSKMITYLQKNQLFPNSNCLNLFLTKINSFKRCNVSPIFEFTNLIEEFKYNQV